MTPCAARHWGVPSSPEIVLVLGATGTTGGHVAAGLHEAGVPVRGVSRRTSPAFDWEEDALLVAVEAMGRVILHLTADGGAAPSGRST